MTLMAEKQQNFLSQLPINWFVTELTIREAFILISLDDKVKVKNHVKNREQSMTAKGALRLIGIGLVFILLVIAYTYVQLLITSAISASIGDHIIASAYELVISRIIENTQMYLFPLHALVYSFVLCKCINEMNKHVMIINALAFCVVSLLINSFVQHTVQWPCDSLLINVMLPPNILCVAITQMVFALLFLSKSSWENTSIWSAHMININSYLLFLSKKSRY